jgi:hypothetical protein
MDENVPRICYREIFFEHLKQTSLFRLSGRGLKLKEILKDFN